MDKIQDRADPELSGDYVPAAYWSTIEMHVGIVCACLPAHRFLLGTLWPKFVGSFKGASATISKSSKAKASKSVYQSRAEIATSSRSNFIPLVDIERGAAGSSINRTPESSVHTVEKYGEGRGLALQKGGDGRSGGRS